jgi:hypothetical protein
MRPVSYPILVTLTVVLVFVTSINCFCQASISKVGNNPRAEQERSCCRGDDHDCDHGDSDHCPDHKNNSPDHSCPHCRGTVVSEVSPVQNATSFLHHLPLVAILDPIQANLLTAVQLRLDEAGDSPPPCMPPTLLGLHCALTL